PVPDGETPFSYLSELCWTGARRRYHPLNSAVVKRLAHELDVIERAGLAEFFLICWDLMRYAKEQGIPAQGRGSATSSIVSYTLGISRGEPITQNLLFERFINPGRTTYPDVDIDFSSERREEVIQYIYRRYGPEHTGMVCQLVTYRARSAVRAVGSALGFPRPLVDRVAKALETYDSVMVRRDLEAEGGFAEFFRRPGEGAAATPDRDEARPAAAAAEAYGLVDGMGQLNTRLPLVGKVPPWRQPPQPADPNAPRPFAWLDEHKDGGQAPPGAEDSGQTNIRGTVGNSVTLQDRAVGPGGSAPSSIRAWEEAVPGPSQSNTALDGFPLLPTAPRVSNWQESRRAQGVGDASAASVGPSRSGMWDGAPESPPSVRPGGRTDDEGGPGDTPASVAWLRAGRGTGAGHQRERLVPPATIAAGGRALDPESGMPVSPDRSIDRTTDRLGRPNHWAGASRGAAAAGAANGPAAAGAAAAALAAGAT